MTKTYHIMHLDDNPAYTQMVNILLSSLLPGDYVITYTDCQQAKKAEKILFESIPDLFICDLMLANHNDPTPGVNLLKKISQTEKLKKMKLMALTANLENGPKKELTPIVDKYQMKDFCPDQFVDDVLALLLKDTTRRTEK